MDACSSRNLGVNWISKVPSKTLGVVSGCCSDLALLKHKCQLLLLNFSVAHTNSRISNHLTFNSMIVVFLSSFSPIV